MENEKIIKIYCSKDKASKEQMWYYYPNLRTEFDCIEKKILRLETKSKSNNLK